LHSVRFEWDPNKDLENQRKHGVSFAEARDAFADPNRVVADDLVHSDDEPRYYCLGCVRGLVMTVRFTWRAGAIRIIGAGFWRKGKATYDIENPLHG
jgi:uncharacterized DUF497 family protein